MEISDLTRETLPESMRLLRWLVWDKDKRCYDGDVMLVGLRVSDDDSSWEFAVVTAEVDDEGCELRCDAGEPWSWDYDTPSIWVKIY